MQRGIISCTSAELILLTELTKTIPGLERLHAALSQPHKTEPIKIQVRADEVEQILDELPPPQESTATQKQLRQLLSQFLHAPHPTI